MSDPFADPRAFRWVESGVSGLARAREWDVTVAVSLPALGDAGPHELEFTALSDLTRADPALVALADLLAAEVEEHLDRPFVARAVRREGSEWTVAARAVDAELVVLGAPIDAETLEVALPPGGEPQRLVDGEGPLGALNPALEAALDLLEARGRKRFQAFAARADKVDDERWQLTVDPL